MKKTLILLCLLALPFFLSAQESAEDSEMESASASASSSKKPVVIPSDIRYEPDVAYLPAGRKEKADIYLPKTVPAGKKLPAVIIIHGGGFNDGDKARRREVNIGSNLARAGYMAMSINYKLRRMQGQVTWPQSLHDAKTAVRWLRANAERLGIDPDRIGVLGCSAGGNLASMLALTRPQDGLDPKQPFGELSSSVRCAINFYGAVDLMNYHDMKMFNKTRAEAPELYKAASPVTYVHKDAPPLLIIHGTDDKVVDVSQSRTLAAALAKVGAPHELVIIPDAPHSFDMEPKERDLRPTVIGFLDKYLAARPPSKP